MTTLNTIAERNNLNYIAKFELSTSIAQHINFRLIFSAVYINDLIIISNIELNLWVLN